MSLKKRMFRSNMMILFLALASLLAVVLLVLVIFEDSIETRFSAMAQTRLDHQIYQVATWVDEVQTQDSVCTPHFKTKDRGERHRENCNWRCRDRAKDMEGLEGRRGSETSKP